MLTAADRPIAVVVDLVHKLCGQDSIGPRGVCAQSIERMSLPISPPPISQSSGFRSKTEDELSEESTSPAYPSVHSKVYRDEYVNVVDCCRAIGTVHRGTGEHIALRHSLHGTRILIRTITAMELGIAASPMHRNSRYEWLAARSR
jgi:hypothetical protein